jgi:hypothetical protein
MSSVKELAAFQYYPPSSAYKVIEALARVLSVKHYATGVFPVSICIYFNSFNKRFLKKCLRESIHVEPPSRYEDDEILQIFKQFVEDHPIDPPPFTAVATMTEFIQLRELLTMYRGDEIAKEEEEEAKKEEEEEEDDADDEDEDDPLLILLGLLDQRLHLTTYTTASQSHG